MKRIFCLISALLLSFPLLLQAGPFMSSGGGVALQDSDGSSGGSAHTLKLSTGDWSVTGGVATLPTGASDNETLINRLIDTWGDAADIDGGTIDGTVIGGTTPAAGTFTSITGTSLNIGDGNATIDNHGAALFRSVSYIRDTENPFCQQYYAGTNYDDNYTEVCAPPTGYSETYRLYWPTAAPTGNQVMVFPVPTLGVSQGTWQDLAGSGDLVSTNNLSDIDNATAARANLGDGLYLPRIAASGSVTHNHGSIASNSCTDAIDGGTATGTATTDTITWNFSGDPTAITGFGHASSGSLFLYCYPTADHVNIKICNNTAGAIDPGEFTINWIVLRK